jgi:hypothetical protein
MANGFAIVVGRPSPHCQRSIFCAVKVGVELCAFEDAD